MTDYFPITNDLLKTIAHVIKNMKEFAIMNGVIVTQTKLLTER